jgi:PPOX class probable FMN-dependent enzyme
MTEAHRITTAEQLDELYGAPAGNSLTKEIDYLSASYRKFVETAPFVIVATSGPGGLDCSPRGDPSGFVRVRDKNTVLIPDRRGNNRIDTLRNLIEDPRISLLFLIPGVGETLRINGRAVIVTDPELCASFEMQGKAPVSVLVVTAERVYFQCPKALVRSRLWSAEAQVPRSELPSSGDIMAEIIDGDYDAEAHDRAYPQRLKETLY